MGHVANQQPAVAVIGVNPLTHYCGFGRGSIHKQAAQPCVANTGSQGWLLLVCGLEFVDLVGETETENRALLWRLLFLVDVVGAPVSLYPIPVFRSRSRSIVSFTWVLISMSRRRTTTPLLRLLLYVFNPNPKHVSEWATGFGFSKCTAHASKLLIESLLVDAILFFSNITCAALLMLFLLARN